MIDVKYPVRKAYFNLLNNNLFYDGQAVPVSDGDTMGKKLYIIIASQSGVDNSTFQTFDSNEDIVIEIISKGNSKASRLAGGRRGVSDPLSGPSCPGLQRTAWRRPASKSTALRLIRRPRSGSYHENAEQRHAPADSHLQPEGYGRRAA
jgi:hypothetical protein